MNFIKQLYAFNSSRYRLFKENELFSKEIPEGAFVLDAGAGISPYKPLLEHTRYESADFEQVDKEYAQSTYICDLIDIPVASARFDYVLFNQVMEHVPEPKTVLQELNRVLKPGGKMIYTGPLFYEEHEEPYDFYRYTQFGLDHLFKETGFIIERMDWLEGFHSTVGYQLKRMSQYLSYKPRDLGGGIIGFLLAPFMLFLKVCFGCLAIFFHKLEILNKFTRKGYPKNYVAIVKKPF